MCFPPPTSPPFSCLIYLFLDNGKNHRLWAVAQIIQNNSWRKALSAHKARGIEDPRGFASAAHLSSSPLSPFFSLSPSPSSSSFFSSLKLAGRKQSEPHTALFSADLHVRESQCNWCSTRTKEGLFSKGKRSFEVAPWHPLLLPLLLLGTEWGWHLY